MTTINQLTTTDSITSGDQIPIYSSVTGDTRKTSLATVTNYLAGKITTIDQIITQYAAPSASGFVVNINDTPNSTWLILTPTSTFAAGTIKLPSKYNCVDRQELLCNCTQIITTLTIDANGATVTGAPTSLVANGSFKLRYDAVMSTWYKIN